MRRTNASPPSFVPSMAGWRRGLRSPRWSRYFVAANPALVLTIARNRPLFWGLMIAQLGIVVWLSARVQSMAPVDGIAAVHRLLRAHRRDDVVRAARIHRRVGGDNVHRHGRDVRSDGGLRHGDEAEPGGWGQFLFMGLIGVVIASFVGMFWHSDGAPVRDLLHRRDRVHGSDRLRRAAAQGDGAGDARRPAPGPTRSSARSRCIWTSSTCS